MPRRSALLGRRLHVAAFVRIAGGQGAFFSVWTAGSVAGVPCVVLHLAVFKIYCFFSLGLENKANLDPKWFFRQRFQKTKKRKRAFHHEAFFGWKRGIFVFLR